MLRLLRQTPVYLLALSAVHCGSLTPLGDGVTVTKDGEVIATNPTTTSSTTATDACDSPDPYEDDLGTGNSCGLTSVSLGDLNDDGATLTVTGDLQSIDDVDWFWVHAVDLEGDVARGWEDFRLDVTLTEGVGSFEIRVLSGACSAFNDICDGTGYDSYSWFIEDTEPDDLGDLPANLQACGDAPLDPCEDHTGDYYIEVVRIDGQNDCTPYEVEIGNGVWSTVP